MSLGGRDSASHAVDGPRVHRSPVEGRFNYFWVLAITPVTNIGTKMCVSGLHSISLGNVLFSLNALFLGVLHVGLMEPGPL